METNFISEVVGDQLTPVTTVADIDDPWLGEGIEKHLEAIPEPDRFLMYITQIAIKRKTAGGIILPGTTVADQEWTHGMALVVKVGPAVYQGKKFEDMGLDPGHAPRAGDVIIFESRAPRRIWVDGRLYMCIPDDAVMARVPRAHLHRVKFSSTM